jgi:hypothetical protein
VVEGSEWTLQDGDYMCLLVANIGGEDVRGRGYGMRAGHGAACRYLPFVWAEVKVKARTTGSDVAA